VATKVCRYHAQNVELIMKFETFYQGLLTKRDKLGDQSCRIP
jgi:hypothetical protein